LFAIMSACKGQSTCPWPFSSRFKLMKPFTLQAARPRHYCRLRFSCIHPFHLSLLLRL
jgi:hypothetical protein